MNFDVRENFKLLKDIHSTERNFYRFYLKIITDYFNLNKKFFFTSKIIPNNGKQTHNENNFCVFNDPVDLFLLCIQDTCFALRKFYSLLLIYVEFASYLSKKSLITIYCASGESLFTAFGLCTVIDAFVGHYGFSHNTNTKKIEVIVIDKRENWRSLCSFIIESVNSCFKNVEIELELINERSSRLTYEIFGTRKEVDIVVMARYLSKFPYMRIRAHFSQVILNRMKELSILFYMDENHEIYYNTLKHLISETDALVEIMNNETVFESLDDFENTEYSSEFSFLRNTVFKPVMFSAYIKCCGIKDNTSAKKGIKSDVLSLNESRRRIKQKILEIFKEKNPFTSHLDESKVKYLKISSKSVLNSSVQTTTPKKLVIKNIKKSSKKTQNTVIYPIKSQITTFSQKDETKMLEHSGDTNILFPSAPTVQSRQNFTPNFQTSRDDKYFEKLQNTDKYLEEKKKPNDETLKTSKQIDKFVSKNSRKKHKYSRKGKEPKTETAKINKAIDKLAFSNPQNNKYSEEGRKSDAESVKSNKVPAHTITINRENKTKQSNCVINSQMASQIATFSQKNEMKLLEHSADRIILFPSIPTVESRQNITPKNETSRDNKDFEKLQDTYKYLEEKRKPNDETLKTRKQVDKFASKKPRKKHKYSGKRKKPNTEIAKTNKAIDNSVFPNPQNMFKYSGEGRKLDADSVKSNKIPPQLIAINRQNKKKQSNITKQNAEIVKSRKVVGKSVTQDLKIKKRLPGNNKANAGKIKRNRVVGMLVTLNLRSKYTYSEEETTSLNADNLEASKRKLASTKLKNKNGYESPHLSTDESLSMYANHLSDIYYSKHFDKCKPRITKFK